MTTKQKTDLQVAQGLLINAFHLMQESRTTTWNEDLEELTGLLKYKRLTHEKENEDILL